MHNDHERRNVVASFDESEIASVHLGALGELFLSPSLLVSQPAYRGSEDLRFSLPLFSSRHPCILPIGNLYCRLSMGKITNIRSHRDLCRRRHVTLELPEFLLRAFESRLAAANEGCPEDEELTIEDLVELQLAEGLSLAEVAHLEREVPGIGAAVSQWLDEIG